MKVHCVDYRVYYEDTDVGQNVYHANYLKFAERARTEWLRSLGIEQSELMETRKILFVVYHLDIHFFSPAKLDEVLTVETYPKEKGKVRMKMVQKIRCGRRKVAALEVGVACVNAQGKPVGLPKDLF